MNNNNESYLSLTRTFQCVRQDILCNIWGHISFEPVPLTGNNTWDIENLRPMLLHKVLLVARRRAVITWCRFRRIEIYPWNYGWWWDIQKIRPLFKMFLWCSYAWLLYNGEYHYFALHSWNQQCFRIIHREQKRRI